MADPIQHGSLKEPIKVTEIRTAKGEYIKWQMAYIDRHTTLARKQKQALHKPAPGVYVDEVLVREIDFTEHVFWFDVSDALNAEQKVLEEAQKGLGLK